MKITRTDINFRAMLTTSEQSSEVALHRPLKGMSHYGNYLEAMKNPKQKSPLQSRSVKAGFKEPKSRSTSAALKRVGEYFSEENSAPPLKKSKKSKKNP